MSLETLITEAVERGVIAAMTKINTAQQPTAETSPTGVTAVEVPPVTKKVGRPKKVAEPVAEPESVVTDTPLPPPAPAPALAVVDDVEADRAKLIAITAKIENGRKVATDMIRKHGQKFDALTPDLRASILAELESMVSA